MKVLLAFLCLISLSYAQMRPRLDPDNDNSTCAFGNRMCPEGVRCFERRDEDRAFNECDTRLSDGADCTQRDFFRGAVEGDNFVDNGRFNPVEVDRERAEGARERDTSRRIHGSVGDRQCVDGLNCITNMCRMREPTECDLSMRNNSQVGCEEDGRFQLLQCRRAPASNMRRCFCANQTNGEMIDGTMRTVMSRDDLPDCTATISCTFQRALRTALLRDGEASARVENGQCMTCVCEEGEFSCREPAGVNPSCPRYDPEEANRECMIDGEVVPHGQRREEGRCNQCTCRNGFVRCTEFRECRGEDNDAGTGDDDDADSRMCDDCMDMPNGPVCAVRDGRTFPTRCHAMRCKGFEMTELRDGPCSEVDACSENGQRCVGDSVCMRRGGTTLMSREAALPNDRRICVNRQEVRCLPTMTMTDGRRRVIPNRMGSDEVGEVDGDEEDQTVCGSDGNSYPSTCHMIIESSDDTVPRVMHPGMCRPANPDRMVCATDGVTYPDEATMRTVGGNVRIDYMGRCDDPDSIDDDTPRQRCMQVRENGRCPSLQGCAMRVLPSDACCPVCGGMVIMAMDQEALDQHTRTTRDLREVDEYMGRFFRPGDRDAAISKMATRRCNISMTLPTTTPGNDVEVLFQAKDTRNDGTYCHEQAMMMVTSVNMVSDPGTVVSNEATFAAALIVAPETSVDGAPAIAASCVMLLAALLVATLL